MIQGSADWFSARLGNLTGSRIYEACAKSKAGKYYASRDDLLMEKLIERLTGQPAQHFVTDAMQWGTMYEVEARAVYETQKGTLVTECAYFSHPSISHSGASPDGLVGEDGVIEIKCPTTSVHLETILSGIIPERHTYQMAWEIESAGRKWADFVSYDPRLPGNLSFFCKRFTLDMLPEKLIVEMGSAPVTAYNVSGIEYIRIEAIKFLAELDELEARVRAYGRA